MADIPNVDHIQFRPDVVGESFELLLEQFKSSENIVKLNTIIATMKQYLDNAVVNLGKLRVIDSATGVALDEIGAQVGVSRDGATDEEYRVVIRIRSFRSRTTGTRPEVIDLISRFTGTPITSMGTHVGVDKSFDISFFTGCLNIEESLSEMVKIFPILSSYRLVERRGSPLGFVSVFDESRKYGYKGFASVFNPNIALGGVGGSIGHLITFID